MMYRNIGYWVKAVPVLLSLSLVLALPQLAMAATATIVSVTTPAEVEAGEQFTVNVAVEPGTEIAGVQFNLSFDPSLVTVDSVAEGNLLSQGGAATYFSLGSIDNVAGIVSGVAGAIVTPGQTVSAAGTFAIITVTAETQGGTCPLTLSGVIAGDINGQPVEVTIVNGQVTINAGTPSKGGGGGGGGGVDNTPPRLANIAAGNITRSTADIYWTTQEISSSQVEYWAGPHQLSSLDETATINHVIHLADLLPATTYHYLVMSSDIAGNLAVSDEYQFTTLGKPAEITVSALSITPEEVRVGEEVVVSTSVTNNGDAAVSYQVVLRIDESIAEIREVRLDGGTTQEVVFNVTMTTEGVRNIDVNGLTGTVSTVAESDATVNLINLDPYYNADTGRLSSVSITYEVNNPAAQPARSEVILNVKLDSQPVDRIVLTPDGSLEPGTTSSSFDYFPSKGWAIGTYTFDIELYEDGVFIHGTAGHDLDVTSEYATPTVNWSVLSIIIGTAFVSSAIATFFVVRYRRQMI
jgi:hypothetical protein